MKNDTWGRGWGFIFRMTPANDTRGWGWGFIFRTDRAQYGEKELT